MPRKARGRAASAAQAAPASMPADQHRRDRQGGWCALGHRKADAGGREGPEIELALGADVPQAGPVGECDAERAKADRHRLVEGGGDGRCEPNAPRYKAAMTLAGS